MGGVTFGEDLELDFALVAFFVVVGDFDDLAVGFDVTVKRTVVGVVFEQVSQGSNIGQVVYCDDFEVVTVVGQHGLEGLAPDASEAIDCNTCHCVITPVYRHTTILIHFASAVRRCSESRTASGAAYIPSTFRADYTTPMTIVRNHAPMGLSHHAPTRAMPRSHASRPFRANGVHTCRPGRCPGLMHLALSGLTGFTHVDQGDAPVSCISPLQGDAPG